MLQNKIFPFFESEVGFDFTLLNKLLETSPTLKDEISNLNSKDLNLFFKLLIDAKRLDSISLLLQVAEEKDLDFNPSLILLSLIKLSQFEKQDFYKIKDGLSLLKNSDSFFLAPFKNHFEGASQKHIELQLQKKREHSEAYREELQDEIAFLQNQQLVEKAEEIEEKLRFHFPEENKEKPKTVTMPTVKTFNSKDQHYSRILERNLSFNLRAQNRKAFPTQHQKNKKQEKKDTQSLAQIWKQSLSQDQTELLITQLEFLNFDQPEFYNELLNQENLDPWTKTHLYLKSEKFLEGLAFLDLAEEELLQNHSSQDTVYSFYYTKALMLLGAGMTKEAEEILITIKEQNENFRDIQILLRSLK